MQCEGKSLKNSSCQVCCKGLYNLRVPPILNAAHAPGGVRGADTVPTPSDLRTPYLTRKHGAPARPASPPWIERR